MKIRNGFVSNSSSSSFVVQIKEVFSKDDKRIVNEEDIKKVLDFGFVISETGSPFMVQINTCHEEEKKIKEEDVEDEYFLKYYVMCNQDDVIKFLVQNNIPFSASIHYGQQYYQFYKNSDKLFVVKNLGEIANMYGIDAVKKEIDNKENLIKEIPIKEIIEKY